MATKKGTTLRLCETTRDLLGNAAHILGKSKSVVVEEALQEYCEKRHLMDTYQVTLTSDRIILLQLGDTPQVLSDEERDGVSPEKAVEDFSKQLRAPVRLVVQKERPWPKKQS